jgi:hypothetical protein
MSRTGILLAIASVVALVSVSERHAQAGLVGLSSAYPAVLYDINTTTGAATFRTSIATGEGASFTGLAYLNGRLYATDVYPPYFNLGTIDPNTGVFTIINNQGGSTNWHGLAADQNQGLLYAIDYDKNYKLVSVTPSGAITYIGAGTGIQGRGMDFDDNRGILYATGPDTGVQSLYKVDTTLGTSTLIGSTGINSYKVGLAFDDTTDTLYMAADPGNQSISSLYKLDVTTGAAMLIGELGVEADGLAFMPSGVPEPTTLIVWSLLGGLAITAGWRRWKHAPRWATLSHQA